MTALARAVWVMRPGSPECDRVSRLVKEPRVLDLLPAKELQRLREWLINITIPQLPTLVHRAAAPSSSCRADNTRRERAAGISAARIVQTHGRRAGGLPWPCPDDDGVRTSAPPRTGLLSRRGAVHLGAVGRVHPRSAVRASSTDLTQPTNGPARYVRVGPFVRCLA